MTSDLRSAGRRAVALAALLCGLSGVLFQPPVAIAGNTDRPGIPEAMAAGSIVVPDATNEVRLRVYTDPSPGAARVFNTFDVVGYGETLVQGPDGDGFRRWMAGSKAGASPHSVLVNGVGPELAVGAGPATIERAAGPGWHWVAFDAAGPYGRALTGYRRAVLFVEPDLFVIHDHLVGRDPARVAMLLHPPAATRVDPVWGDLRLELPKAGLTIQTPAARNRTHVWERVDPAADLVFPGTVAVRMSATNTTPVIDLLTVVAVHRAGTRRDGATKFLESNTAVGARIHRDGLPTLVAFRTGPMGGQASLTGFGFEGPVGVSVFRPKQRNVHPAN
ncbi:MAG: hypothetical protein DVB31_15570 [Verrucomicrobia bacterium]|nr:MAG: hypothetical protein DVB31_15570 [Verrucomicrobiota bacterium]